VGARGRLRLAVVVWAAVCALAFGVSGAASAGYSLLFAWGSQGSGPGQFDRPAGVAVDTSGNVDVVDSGNNRLEQFDSAGSFRFQFGVSGVDSGRFSQPYGIAVESAGRIDVVDSGNNRVERFDSLGNFQAQFGAAGSGPGRFDAPAGIAVDGSGNIDVVDSGNNRVEQFDSAGNLRFQFGSAGSGPGQFSSPTGIAVTAAGDILVTDTGNDRVEVYDSAGIVRFQFGSAGSGPGQFSSPTGVAVTAAGDILVADTGNDRIEDFDAVGNPRFSFGTSAGPTGVALDAAGDVYVTDASADRVEKFSGSSGGGTQDTTPPTLTATATANGNSYQGGTWTRFDVVVHFDCMDDPGGSGVASVTQDQTVTTEGAGQSVSGTCSDRAGNSTSATFSGIDIDKTSPTVSAPDVTVDATGSAGAAVSTYPVTVKDNLDTGPRLACVPAAPHLFPIGDTTVTCTATDASGNAAGGSFTVHVKGAAAQLADLAAAVAQVGPGRSLEATVEVARWFLALGQPKLMCLTLAVFRLEVRAQSGKTMPATQAAALIADATRIESVVGCTT